MVCRCGHRGYTWARLHSLSCLLLRLATPAAEYCDMLVCGFVSSWGRHRSTSAGRGAQTRAASTQWSDEDRHRLHRHILCVPIKTTSTSYFMNDYVKNQVISMIFGTHKPEEISHKWDLLFPSKTGRILNSNWYTIRQLKFQKSKTAETAKSVGHVCAPNIVKTGWFLTEIFKK